MSSKTQIALISGKVYQPPEIVFDSPTALVDGFNEVFGHHEMSPGHLGWHVYLIGATDPERSQLYLKVGITQGKVDKRIKVIAGSMPFMTCKRMFSASVNSRAAGEKEEERWILLMRQFHCGGEWIRSTCPTQARIFLDALDQCYAHESEAWLLTAAMFE